MRRHAPSRRAVRWPPTNSPTSTSSSACRRRGAHHHAGHRTRFLQPTVQQVPRGTGTGFVWTTAATSSPFPRHPGRQRRRVTLADQSTWRPSWWRLPDRDLAVLKIDAPATKLPAIRWAPAATCRWGRRCTRSATLRAGPDADHGIVSALNREIESFNSRTIRGVIQTTRRSIRATRRAAARFGRPADRREHADRQPSGASAGIGFAIRRRGEPVVRG